MDTAVNMRVVGSEMDHIEALRAMLEPILGMTPSISVRLEIIEGGTRTIITVTDGEIVVSEEPGGRIVAQGDWALAKAALAGMPPA